MSNNQLVIDTLSKKLVSLREEQQAHWHRLQEQINEVSDAILVLSGQKTPLRKDIVSYDDESPDYIRNTEDGI